MSNLWERYNKIIFIFIILALVLAVVVKNSQLNKAETSLSEQDKQVAALEKEIQEQDKEDEKENTDTFDKDLDWFVTNVYESNDPFELYNKVKDSVSEEAMVQLVGEEIPTSPQPDSDVVTKKVQAVDVFGKYIGEDIYEAVVTFDYEYQYKDTVQKIQKVVQIELKDKEGIWFVTNFEEVQLGDNYAS